MSLAYSAHAPRLSYHYPSLTMSLSLACPLLVTRLPCLSIILSMSLVYPVLVPCLTCHCLLITLPMYLAYPTVTLFMSFDNPVPFPWFTLSQSLLYPFSAPRLPCQ
jgi:hypothetical protein